MAGIKYGIRINTTGAQQAENIIFVDPEQAKDVLDLIARVLVEPTLHYVSINKLNGPSKVLLLPKKLLENSIISYFEEVTE